MTTDRRPSRHPLLSRFLRAEGGNVAMLFAFVLVPLILSAGALIDYSTAIDRRVELNSLADAAALSAVSRSAMSDTPEEARRQAEILFDSQLAGVRAKLGSRTVAVTQVGSQRSVEVNYTAKVDTSFMHLAGIESVDIKGLAKSTASSPPYIDFYLLLDNSPSMGVGATPDDMARLVANTPDRCAFACHDRSNKDNYYQLSKKLGVTMRIDVVRQAAQKLMDTATSSQVLKKQFRMAAYTFGDNCDGKKLTRIKGITSDLSSVKSAANKIDLMTIPYQNYDNDQCTDFDANLTAIDKEISAPGDGYSSNAPQKVLYFVADGVGDFYNPTGCSKPLAGARCQEPIDTKFCERIKQRGIKIAVLYTTYLPIDFWWYNDWIRPFQSQIGRNMEECASPGLYFEVSPTNGISQAMDALFQRIVAKAYLSG